MIRELMLVLLALNEPTILTTVGTGQQGYGGDGGPASQARLDQPFDVAFDAQGNLFLSDTFNHRIRKVDRQTGVIRGGGGGAGGGGAAEGWRRKQPPDPHGPDHALIGQRFSNPPRA